MTGAAHIDHLLSESLHNEWPTRPEPEAGYLWQLSIASLATVMVSSERERERIKWGTNQLCLQIYIILLLSFRMVFRFKARKRLKWQRNCQKAAKKILDQSMALSALNVVYLLFIIFSFNWLELVTSYVVALTSCIYGLVILITYSFSIKLDQELESKPPKIQVCQPSKTRGVAEEEELMPIETIPPHGPAEIFIHQLDPMTVAHFDSMKDNLS